MSNLKDLINNIKVQQSVQNESYVSYDKKDGKIYKITSKRPLDTEYQVIAVPTEIITPVLEGSKSVNDFTVVYDFSSKQVVVKQVNYEDHYSSANLFMHEFSKIKLTRDGHSNFDKIYDGINVDVWIKQDSYNEGQLVFYKGNVYKLLEENKSDEDFNFHKATLFIKDIKLSNVSTVDHTVDLIVKTPIFEGIHVDVWYSELEHVSGQHVFYKGTVYKIKNDQTKNTAFKKENTEIVVENVILNNDENKLLEFAEVTQIGDKFLDYNKLYMLDKHQITHDREFGEIFFYSNNNLIEVNQDEVSVINLATSDIYSVETEFLNIEDVSVLPNGSKVLIGKELYSYSLDREFDLIIRQNNKLKRWEFSINPYTKKFLKTAGYSTDDVVYFSVTEKYDPNILYKSLTVSVQDLITKHEYYINFDDNWDPKNVESSVYTTKYFENYGYEVID